MINPKTNNLATKGLIWPNEGKSRQETEAGHFTSIGKSRKKQIHYLCPLLISACFLFLRTVQGQIHTESISSIISNQDSSPTDLITDRHDLDYSTIRLSSLETLRYVKLIVETSHRVAPVSHLLISQICCSSL